jgi:hypothetical protein
MAGGLNAESKGRNLMGQKDCFGSLKEIGLDHTHTTTQAKFECRNCEEIRDCLRYSKQLAEEEKERVELRKQNMISQIIDLSHITSNEIGSCLLEFLSRIFYSPLGTILFKNLLLFCEVPQNSSSFNLSIPMSRTMMDLIRGGVVEGADPGSFSGTKPQPGFEEGFTLRIVLFQRSFPNHPEANMGMIAYEVARVFATDDLAVKQILPTLSDVERDLFKKMDIDRRTNWLIAKWGFLEEFEALEREMATAKLKEQLDASIKE